MEKLLKKGAGSYHIQLAGQNYFFTGFEKRVKFELSEEITLSQLAAKIDECVEKITELEQKIK